jgi:hypothetical protein
VVVKNGSDVVRVLPESQMTPSMCPHVTKRGAGSSWGLLSSCTKVQIPPESPNLMTYHLTSYHHMEDRTINLGTHIQSVAGRQGYMNFL